MAAVLVSKEIRIEQTESAVLSVYPGGRDKRVIPCSAACQRARVQGKQQPCPPTQKLINREVGWDELWHFHNAPYRTLRSLAVTSRLALPERRIKACGHNVGALQLGPSPATQDKQSRKSQQLQHSSRQYIPRVSTVRPFHEDATSFKRTRRGVKTSEGRFRGPLHPEGPSIPMQLERQAVISHACL